MMAATLQSEDKLLASKQLELIYRRDPLAFGATLLLSGLLAIALWPMVSHAVLLAWLLSLWLVMAVRTAYARRYLKLADDAVVDHEKWQIRMLVGAMVSGICWGFSVLSIPSSPTDPAAMILLFSLAGVAAFSGISMAAVPLVAQAFLLPALLPVSFWLFSFGARLPFLMGAMTLVYLVLMLLFSRQAHHAIKKLLSTTERNKELAAALDKVQALERESALFRHVVDKTRDPAIFVTNTKNPGGFDYINEAACAHFGASREEILSWHASDWDPHCDDSTVGELHAVLGREGSVQFESEHLRASGERFPVEVTLNQVEFDGESFVVGYFHSLEKQKKEEAVRQQYERDMTRQESERRMIEALRASEQEFRSLAENSSDNIARWDAEGRFLYLNPVLERTLRVKAEETIGTQIDKSKFAEVAAAISRVFETGEAVPAVREFASGENGATLIHEVSLIPERNSRGEIVSVLGLGRDITERVQAQQQMELLDRAINLSSDAVFLVDEDARFCYVNDMACRSLGYSREELLAMGPSDIDPDMTREMCLNLIRSGTGKPFSLEARYQTRNGRIFPVELSGVTSEQQGKKTTLIFARDISIRKRVERVLRFIADPGNDAGAEGFLAALSRFLGEELGVRYVIIDKLGDEPGMAETVALYANGGIAPNMKYALKDTPCDNVIGKSVCYYPQGIQALFPRDSLLADMGAESYAAIPLWDSAGKPIGLIAVIDDAPLADESAIVQILQLAGPRVAAELERGQIERMLRDREREFRSLADNLPDVVVRYDRECRRVYVNPAWEKANGIPAQEVIGKSPQELSVRVKPISADFERMLRGVMESGQPDSMELNWRNEAGRQVCFELNAIPEFDSHGAAVSVLTVARDISEKKEVQRHTEQFVANFPGFVYSYRMTPDGRDSFPFASPGIEKLYGLKPADVKDNSVALHALAHPDDAPGIIAALSESAHTMSPVHMEYRICRPGLPERWTEFRSSPVREADGSIVWHGIMVDIDERKRAAEALLARERDSRQQAQFQQTLLSGMRDAGIILVVVEEGCFVYTNDHYVGCNLGYKKGQLPDTVSFMELIHPDDRPRIAGMHRDRMAGKPVPTSYEIGALCGDGSRAEYEFHVMLVPDSNPPQTLLLALDIGERKRAAEALEENERRMVRYFANTPGYFQMTELRADGSFAVPFASDGIVELFGIQPDDVKANVAALAALNHPDDTEMVFRKAAESARDLTPYQVEYRINHPQKGLRWIECIGSPERLADGGTRWYGFMHDITERKRMEKELTDREQELRSLMENLPDNIARMDAAGRVLFSNPVHQRSLGKTAAEMIGKTYGELFPDRRYAPVEEAIAQVVATGKPAQFVRQPVPFENGETRIHDVNLVPEYDADGKVVSVLGIGRDMTETYRLQEEVVSRERQLRALADSSPGMMGAFYARPDGSICMPYVSPNIEELFGLRPQDVADNVSSLMALNHPDDAQRVGESIAESARNMTVWHEEYRILHPTRGVRWMESNTKPEPHPDGGIVWYGYVHDITERKQASEQLIASRKMLADAQKIARLGSWDWDVAGDRVEWSEVAYEIYTPDQHPAEPGFEDFKASVHPDDLDMVVAAVQAAFEHDAPFELDHRVVSASKGVRTVHAQGIVFRDATGKPVRMVGTVQDITERKQAEIKLQENLARITELNGYLEKNTRDLEEQTVELEMSQQQLQQTEAWYRSILHSAPDGMLIVDSRGLIMQVNEQLEKMFGYGAGELPGRHVEVLLPQPLRESHVGLRNKFISGGDKDRRMAGSANELYGCRKDGSVFPVDISLSKLPDLDGRTGATCAAVRDVTERQKMDKAREAALSEALRLAQLRSTFMAQMSHELRTPLNGILGYAQNLLLAGALAEKQVAGLHVIRQSGEHLLSLINGLLDHAAIEAGKFELVPGDIEMDQFLGAIIGMIRIRAEEKNISFICAAAADLPAVVRGDAQRLRQVLLNLLANAVKFTDSGEVVLRVSRATPSRIRFEVRDSGVGIAADQLENIFLPFEQAGEAQRRAGGTGLGLAISRKLVRLMGGDILVESRLGEGSTFSFEIEMEDVHPGSARVDAAALAAQAVTRVVQATPLLAVPSRQELEVLHEHALRGSMRDVMRHAEQLAEADERYRPFADQLCWLAKSFQTKALESLIEQYRDGMDDA